MTHSAAMAGEILIGKTILEALNTDLVCDAINTAMRELFLQIVYGRTQSAFSEGGLSVGAGMSGNVRDPDGRLIPGDALQVKTMSGIEQPLDSMCPYVYEAAVSPHLASRMEGNPVQLSLVRDTFQQVCGEYDYVTMLGRRVDELVAKIVCSGASLPILV